MHTKEKEAVNTVHTYLHILSVSPHLSNKEQPRLLMEVPLDLKKDSSGKITI